MGETSELIHKYVVVLYILTHTYQTAVCCCDAVVVTQYAHQLYNILLPQIMLVFEIWRAKLRLDLKWWLGAHVEMLLLMCKEGFKTKCVRLVQVRC